MTLTSGEITRLLTHWSDGDPKALERLMPLVFEDLRRLARKQFRAESPGHTLQPTALVSEVYMRLTDQREVQWDNRSQFFAFAAMLMRRILVDYAKARRTAKRGGDVKKLPLNEALAMAAPATSTWWRWTTPCAGWRKSTPGRPGWWSCAFSSASPRRRWRTSSTFP